MFVKPAVAVTSMTTLSAHLNSPSFLLKAILFMKMKLQNWFVMSHSTSLGWILVLISFLLKSIEFPFYKKQIELGLKTRQSIATYTIE